MIIKIPKTPMRIRSFTLALMMCTLVLDMSARERRDIVFECPCSAEFARGDPGELATLTLHAGVRNYRATPSGEIALQLQLYSASRVTLQSIPPRTSLRGTWRMSVRHSQLQEMLQVDLSEYQSEESRRSRTSHESLFFWQVPKEGEGGSTYFVDLLTDTDMDGVGDVNERLAGTDPGDSSSVPAATEIDLLALYTAAYEDMESGYPYTRLLHDMNVTRMVFEDSKTNIELRTIGISEVELGAHGWVERDVRDELMDSHGADLAIQFAPDSVACRGLGGCAGIGATRGNRWRHTTAQLYGGSVLLVAHELGHVMGLVHSARQGEAHGAWRWSRGHYVSPSGESNRYGTIMAYGAKVLGGVFSDPSADCGDGVCGVPIDELDGADAVTTLNRMRFQIGAHRPPAEDSDDDGIVDAADAFPNDPNDWFDIDGDGIGDTADLDNDNDGTNDVDDAFPFDPNEWADADRDGIGDNVDDDIQDLSPFKDPGLRAAVERALKKEAGAEITAEEMTQLTRLSASFMNIVDLTGLELATELTNLSLPFNDVADIEPLANLTALRQLSFHRNRIVDLTPLAQLSRLEVLRLSENPVSDITVLDELESLRYLYLNDAEVDIQDVIAMRHFSRMRGLGLRGMGVTDLSVLAELPLEILDLSDNEDVDVSTLPSLSALRTLRLNANDIEDISSLSDMPKLRTLELHENRITDLTALREFEALQYLYLSDNDIEDISPLSHIELLTLDISKNPITDISVIAEMMTLQTLYLSDNDIDDIPPLSGTVMLRNLDLHNNRISDLAPLSTMTGLRWLNLNENFISDIGPLTQRTIFGGTSSDGAWIGLDRNPLDETSISDHIPLLESWGVRVTFQRGRDISPAPATLRDPTLHAVVNEALAGGFVHKDDDPVVSRIDRVQRLQFINRGVTDLTGLELANNLELLYGASNQIVDLSPLADLAELSELDLRDNRIVDIAPLVANDNLNDGDWISLAGNPLNQDSLNVHIPALLERGVQVNVDRIELALVVDGESLRYETAGYFRARLGADLSISASSEEGSIVTTEMHGDVLIVTPGSSPGSATVRLEATADNGATSALSFTVIVRGVWHLPLFPSMSDRMGRQGVLRMVNRAPSGNVEIVPIDDSGLHARSVTFEIGTNETIHLNATDIENGNIEKGIESGSGAGSGDWRLGIRTALDLKVAAYVHTSDGFLTAMHDVTKKTTTGEFFVSIFNPANNEDHSSVLRLMNLDDFEIQATIRGIDDQGESPGNEVRVNVPVDASVTLTAHDLEAGSQLGNGALGDGSGRWRLHVTSDGELAVMNLLTNPKGHLVNLSTNPSEALSNNNVHSIPLFMSASDPLGRRGFVRIINRSDHRGKVVIRAFVDSGQAYEPLELSLDARHAVQIDSNDLELGNESKGLSGSTGSGYGDWRLELSSELDIEVHGYTQAPSGFFTSMHDVVTATGRRYDVLRFNPAHDTDQVSVLRIVNPNSVPAHVSIAGENDVDGKSEDVVRFDISGGATRTLTASDLESGRGVRGKLGDGSGKWRLMIDCEQPILIMNLLSSPTGHLINLSS